MFLGMNKTIRILFVGSNLWYLGEGMLGPLFAVFTERIGGDILDISWAWATYWIVMGVLYVVVGKYSDGHHAKKKLMVLGYALNALFTFGYLFVRSPWHLFIVQGGLGLAAACANPTWLALYAKYEDKKQDGFEWGMVGGIGHIMLGLALVIGGLIVNYFSFTLLFVTMGCIQVLATLYQARILGKKGILFWK